uniref:Nucleotide-diphospho-sugar transferase domain-containing protein n=1 Tax=Globisporangium ultimum (strain ATCC 200006 / CBS 805.95 / DAOM BR144) TaxID=431595 RepID=K3XC31_GLOUD
MNPSSHAATPLSSRVRHIRLKLLFGVIGVYALSFILWCTFFQGERGTGLAGLFPKGYNEKLNRMLELVLSTTSHSNARNRTISAAAGDMLGRPRTDDLECVGWRHTQTCDPNTHILQSYNRSCEQHIRGGHSGFCAMKDKRTGREVRVLKCTCVSVRSDVIFNCNQALDFVRFREETESVLAEALAAEANESANAVVAIQETLTSSIDNSVGELDERDGIVMVTYPNLLVGAYATVKTLRETHNCVLPIEIWYLESELGPNATTNNKILTHMVRDFAPLTFVPILDKDVNGFNSKVHAILHTNLTNILFLDSDNVPAKDPTYVFQLPQFTKTGAIFWPDFWHPVHSIFNINEQSLLWELLGLDFVDMFEQESGQLLINKRKSRVALQLLEYFAFHRPSIFESMKLAWGDKDLFRLAWLKSNTPFHMVEAPPAMAGEVRLNKFCGMTMVQFDPLGDALFLHRNARKVNGGRPALGKEPDAPIWSHLQMFKYNSNATTVNGTATTAASAESKSSYAILKEFYKVQIYNGVPQFKASQWCYGQEKPHDEQGHFQTVPWSETALLPMLESQVLAFAKEGAALLPPSTVVMAST